MSELAKRDGGTAFPATRWEPVTRDGAVAGHAEAEYPGMSLRDYFAAEALPAVYTENGRRDNWNADDAAVEAYQIADAMLKAREAK